MIRRKPHAKLFKLLQGYLDGCLAMLTGLRPVVLANLQKEKVREAETDNQNRAVIWVNQHKTDRVYGNAFLALLPPEVAWLEGLMEVSAHFGREDCPYVFQFNGMTFFLHNKMCHRFGIGHILFYICYIQPINHNCVSKCAEVCFQFV